MHRHLADPEPVPRVARARREQRELVRRVVHVHAALLDLERVDRELVRDDLFAHRVVVVELGVHLLARRPHAVDLFDARLEALGRVVPLCGAPAAVDHKGGKEPEEALGLVSLAFAVVHRLLAEDCCGDAVSATVGARTGHAHSSISTLRWAAAATSYSVAFWPIQ